MCPNGCAEVLVRSEVEFHLARCLHRLVACVYCGEGESLNNHPAHHKVCPKRRVPCVNKCGTHILQSDMETHIRDDCPKYLVNCEYCGKSVARGLLVDHMSETKPHIEFLVKTTRNLESRLAEAEKRIITLSEGQKSFIWRFRYQEGATHTSPVFFKGYAFCVFLQPNPSATHVGIFVQLVEGPCDDQLPWPFRGRFCFQILNPKENKDHFTSPIIDSTMATEEEIARTWQRPGLQNLGFASLLLKSDILGFLRDGMMTLKAHVSLCDEWLFSS